MERQSDEEARLAAELSSCMLSHYKYCAAGVLLGLPLSIHKKSYWPVTLAAVAGTAADFKEGSANCRRQREALMAYVARKNRAAEVAKTQQAPPGTTEQNEHSQPQDAWPVDGQQGWPEKGWDQNFASGGGGGVDEAEKEGKGRW